MGLLHRHYSRIQLLVHLNYTQGQEMAASITNTFSAVKSYGVFFNTLHTAHDGLKRENGVDLRK